MKETLEKAAERLFPFTKDDSENRIITIKRLFGLMVLNGNKKECIVRKKL